MTQLLTFGMKPPQKTPLVGLGTWLIAGGICLVGGIFGCCLIPFCVDGLKVSNVFCERGCVTGFAIVPSEAMHSGQSGIRWAASSCVRWVTAGGVQ